MRKITQDEFISKANKVHGEKYDYTLVKYTTTHEKVIVICKKHSKEFLQAPSKHLTGKGCPICGNEARAAGKQSDITRFITSAKTVHGDAYDYSQAVYISATDKVEILCNTCGDVFHQMPSGHLSGHGCPSCSGVKRWTTESFITAAKDVHGDKYLYDSVVYVRSKSDVSIYCNVHHKHFEQAPSSHLSGSGCPSCAINGYNTGKAGSIYILKSGDITKVGITNREVITRASKISRSSGLSFNIESQIKFSDGAIPKTIESALLKELRITYEQPKNVFDGSTECFYDVDYDLLLGMLVQETSCAYETN